MAEFIKVDALGDACPLPVVKAKKAISELQGAGQVEVLVDNEIAVQNLTKMAQQKCYQYSAEKLEERKYRVLLRPAQYTPAHKTGEQEHFPAQQGILRPAPAASAPRHIALQGHARSACRPPVRWASVKGALRQSCAHRCRPQGAARSVTRGAHKHRQYPAAPKAPCDR